jgi:hypothetical protein
MSAGEGQTVRHGGQFLPVLFHQVGPMDKAGSANEPA